MNFYRVVMLSEAKHLAGGCSFTFDYTYHIKYLRILRVNLRNLREINLWTF